MIDVDRDINAYAEWHAKHVGQWHTMDIAPNNPWNLLGLFPYVYLDRQGIAPFSEYIPQLSYDIRTEIGRSAAVLVMYRSAKGVDDWLPLQYDTPCQPKYWTPLPICSSLNRGSARG